MLYLAILRFITMLLGNIIRETLLIGYYTLISLLTRSRQGNDMSVRVAVYSVWNLSVNSLYLVWYERVLVVGWFGYIFFVRILDKQAVMFNINRACLLVSGETERNIFSLFSKGRFADNNNIAKRWFSGFRGGAWDVVP